MNKLSDPDFIKLPARRILTEEEMIRAASDFYLDIKTRRTVREYSSRPVPRAIIEHCINAAASAPSGANMQPWHFAVIEDASIKERIRKDAEKEEQEFYRQRAPKEWLDALAPLGTDEHKPFLTTAPFLIVVFARSHNLKADGSKVKNYYVRESVGIATGLLLCALHYSGLVSLTHTPSPMGFLNKICKRPKNEKPYMIVVTGYPDDEAMVPVYGMKRKELDEIVSFF